jgi:hypothetical protein
MKKDLYSKYLILISLFLFFMPTLLLAAPVVSRNIINTTGPTGNDWIDFHVKFSEVVVNFVAEEDLIFATTGTVAYTGVAFSQPYPDLTWYRVLVTGITGNGTLSMDLKSGSGVIDWLESPNGIYNESTNPVTLGAGVQEASWTVKWWTTSVLVTSGDVWPGAWNCSNTSDCSPGTPYFTLDIAGWQAPSHGNQITFRTTANSTNVQNGSGEALAAGLSSATVTIDNIQPIADVITPVTASPTNNNTVSFTVHFTEDVQSFDAEADLSVGTTGTLAYTGVNFTGGPQQYTVEFTGVSGDGNLTLAAETGSDVKDLAFNALASSVTSTAVVVDNTAPQCEIITNLAATLTNVDTVVYSVHFTEAVQDFDAQADVTVYTSGTVAYTGISIADGPQTYTVSVTGVSGDGHLNIAANNGGVIRDLAGNPLFTSVSSSTVHMDNTPPRVTAVTPSPSPANSSSINFWFVFSEGVINFDAESDLSLVEGGTLAHVGVSFSAGTSQYGVDITGITGAGTMTVGGLLGSGVQDNAGNLLASSVTADGIIDRVAPTADTITPSTLGPTNASSIDFTVDFSENVINFDAQADLIINTTGSITYSGVGFAGAGSSYTVTVSGITGAGTMTMAVGTGTGVRDELSNNLASSVTSASVSIDRVGPTADVITPSTLGPTNATSVSFAVGFDEDVLNFDAEADLIITETGSVAHTGITFACSGQNYTIDITGISGDGSITLAVRTDSGVTDSLGNTVNSGVTSTAVVVDNTSPSVTSFYCYRGAPSNYSYHYVITAYSENVTNVDITDYSYTTTGTLTTTPHSANSWYNSGGIYYYYNYYNNTSGDGAIIASINPANNIQDSAGNSLNSFAGTAACEVDQTAPQADIISPVVSTGPTNDDAISFNVHFTENIYNFDTDTDLVITETGTVVHSGIGITGSGQDFVVTINNISGEGTLTLAINTASNVRDIAGNILSASVTSAAVIIDNSGPQADIITPSPVGPTNSTSIDFAVHFNETVVNFNTEADIFISEAGVTHTGVSFAGSGQDYIVTVSGISGDGTITLMANTGSDIQDAADNSLNSSISSAAVTIDNTRPAADVITPSTLGPTNVDNLQFVIGFDEPVLNFDTELDLVITETGTITHAGVAIAGLGQNYTVTVSGITGDGTISMAVAMGAGVQDLSGNELASSITSTAVSIDNTPPYIANAWDFRFYDPNPNNEEYQDVIAYFSENVSNYDLTDVIITPACTHSGVFSWDWLGITGYSIWCGPVAGEGTLTARFNPANDITDLAGNSFVFYPAVISINYDLIAPHADVITPVPAGPTNSGTIAYTVHFTEDVENFDAEADLTITETGTAAHAGISFAGSGDTYIVSLTGITGDGTIVIAVKTDSGVQDPADNALASSVSSAAVVIDNTPPAANSITLVTTNPTNLATIEFAITFFENVFDFDAEADLAITQTGTVAHTGVTFAGSGAIYTIQITGVTGDGTVILAVDTAGDTHDIAGNTVSSSVSSVPLTIDNTPPVAITVSPTTPSPTAFDTVRFIVRFNEAVINFNNAADLIVTETGTVGHAGIVIDAGLQNWVVYVTGVTGDGTMRLSVDTFSDVKDHATNPLFASVTSAALDIDNSGTSVGCGDPPPFITAAVEPNIILALDISGSMKAVAYRDTGAGNWKTGLHDDFNPAVDYYGYFNKDSQYSYNSSFGFFIENAAGTWNGNFMNWMAMRRIDVARKVMIGGKVRDRQGESLGGSTWYVLQGNHEPYDYTFQKSYANGSTYTPYPDDTVFLMTEGSIVPQTAGSQTVTKISDSDAGDPGIEMGVVTMDWQNGDPWREVEFGNSYVNPVVVANAVSYNGSQPVGVRVKDIGDASIGSRGGFRIRLQEWDYLDGNHTTEDVMYIVVEAGRHTVTLTDSSTLEFDAQSFTTSATGVSNFVTRGFSGAFAATPVLYTGVGTFNDPAMVVTRNRNISTTGFQVVMQEEEAADDIRAANEVIHCVAATVGKGVTSVTGAKIEIDTYGDVVSNSWRAGLFKDSFSSIPLVVMDMQTTDGTEPANLRWKARSAHLIRAHVDEEQSSDNETNHTNENVGYIAVLGGGLLNIQVGTLEEPTGIIQNLSGDVRFGLNVYNFDHSRNVTSVYTGNTVHGGTFKPCYPDVSKEVNDRTNYDICLETHVKAPLANIIEVIETYPLVWGTTPIAETLYEIYGYAAQLDHDVDYTSSLGRTHYYENGTDGNNHCFGVYNAGTGQFDGINTYNAIDCVAAGGLWSDTDSYNVNNDWDPFYYDRAGQTVDCAMTFVLHFNDGAPYRDWDGCGHPDMAGWNPNCADASDYDGDANPTASHTGSGGKTEILDDLALYLRKNDIRTDIDNHQEIISYYVYAALGEGEINNSSTRKMRESAVNGGFVDEDDDHQPDPAHPGNFISYINNGGCSENEWDSDGDCNPDTFFNADNGFELVTQLTDAFTDIIRRASSGTAVSTITTSSTMDDYLVKARFLPISWKGYLEAFTMPYSDGDLPIWEAGGLLANRVADRNIYTYMTTAAAHKQEFVASNISLVNSLSTQWGKTTAESRDLLNYIRGDSVHEGGKYRERNGWPLGDIIYSTPVSVSAPKFYYRFDNYQVYKRNYSDRVRMLYVGANDGMLHAFRGVDDPAADCSGADAGTDLCSGVEHWAFIPENIQANLQTLAEDDCHNYFVDLTPVAADIHDGMIWKTVLVGGLRLGGHEYYCLDVTNPEHNRFEVLWDKVLFTDRKSTSLPIIDKFKGGVVDGWLAVVTSGYHEGNLPGGIAAFNFVDGTKETIWNNGVTDKDELITNTRAAADPYYTMSSPMGADTDNDGYIDLIYAGDTRGSLWKFYYDYVELVWKKTELFNTGGQAITAKPKIVYGRDSGVRQVLIYFGTGKYINEGDKNNAIRNSFYCIVDRAEISATANNGHYTRTTAISKASDIIDVTAIITRASFDALSSTDRGKILRNGWYFDLDMPVASSERILDEAVVLAGMVFFTSFIPDTAVCGFGGGARLYGLDYRTGLPGENEGETVLEDMEDSLGNRRRYRDLGSGMPSKPVFYFDRASRTPQLLIQQSDASVSNPNVNIEDRPMTIQSWSSEE